MRYFHISCVVSAPTWNMRFYDYAVPNADEPERSAIEFHVRKMTKAPADAPVVIFQIAEITEARYKALQR